MFGSLKEFDPLIFRCGIQIINIAIKSNRQFQSSRYKEWV